MRFKFVIDSAPFQVPESLGERAISVGGLGESLPPSTPKSNSFSVQCVRA